MKNLFRYSLWGALLLCWVTTACNDRTVYHSYRSFSSGGWERSDTLVFPVSVSDSVLPVLHLYAEVRNRTDYPYRDLHLLFSQNLQDSSVWHTDTVTFCLADSTGRWLGKGWGSIYQSAVFVRSVRPLQVGNYEVRIVYGMPDEKILGINDIGVKIDK